MDLNASERTLKKYLCKIHACKYSQSFDLIITFDNQDKVNDYSVISTSF
jgi:hypothetical protein